jgi:hypothetical protein
MLDAIWSKEDQRLWLEFVNERHTSRDKHEDSPTERAYRDGVRAGVFGVQHGCVGLFL